MQQTIREKICDKSKVFLPKTIFLKVTGRLKNLRANEDTFDYQTYILKKGQKMKNAFASMAIILGLMTTTAFADHDSDSSAIAEYSEELAEHCSHLLDEIESVDGFSQSVVLIEELEEAANHFHDEILENDGDWNHIGEDFVHFKEAYSKARSTFRRDARAYRRRTGENHVWHDWNGIYHQYRKIKKVVRRRTL